MGVVTTITLQVASECEISSINLINKWMISRGYWPLFPVQDYYAGLCANVDVFGGSFKRFDDDDFVEYFLSLIWVFPEDAILLINPESSEDEHSGKTRVVVGVNTRPDGYDWYNDKLEYTNPIAELLEALTPIIHAVWVNDGDTLSRISIDGTRIWTASGSWSPDVTITLGHFRKIEALANAIHTYPRVP